MKLIITNIFALIIFTNLYSQFQNQIAIFKDSKSIVAWATSCNIKRGYIKISDKNFEYEGSKKASFGTNNDAVGVADNIVVSLGDSGIAVLTFDMPIRNNNGYDFAIFENSFDGKFLELAFVEVSSDGQKFVRFPSVSLTQTQKQIGGFEELNHENIYNLAGKYQSEYGTPFDLKDIKDSVGIDINSVTHIKIVDVIGSIDKKYASLDSKGNIINDPFPTPFNTSGFDLDAVAVLSGTNSISQVFIEKKITISPNPTHDYLKIQIKNKKIQSLIIKNIQGKLVYKQKWKKKIIDNSIMLNISSLKKGIYLISIIIDNKIYYKNFVKL